MTAQSSRIDMNNFGKYFFFKLKSLRGSFVLQMLLAVLAYPFVGIVGIFAQRINEEYTAAANVYNKLYDEMGEAVHETREYLIYQDLLEKHNIMQTLFVFSLMILVGALAGIAIMHFLTQVKAFRWLWNKETVDMDYALPVSGDARFFGDFLASLLVSAVPHLLSVIAAIAIACGSPEWQEILPSAAVAQTAISGFAACIMFSCMNMLVLSLCGRRSTAFSMPIFVNFALPAFLTAGIALLHACAYGINTTAYMEFYDVAPYSPIGLCIGAVIKAVVSLEYNIYGYAPAQSANYINTPKVLLPVLVITLGCFLLAWFFVRRRRSERVGSAYAVPAARHVLHIFLVLAITVLAALIALMFYTNGNDSGFSMTIMWYFVLSFIVYISLEMTAVGLKKFGFTVLRYLAAAAGSLLVCLGIMTCDNFGIGMKPPSANSIKEVNFYVYSPTSATYDYSVSERENIEKVIELHKQVPDERGYKNVFEGLSEGVLGFDRIFSRSHSYSKPVLQLNYYFKDGTYRSYSYIINDEYNERFIKETTVPETFLARYYYLDSKSTAYRHDGNTDEQVTGWTVSSENNMTPVSGLTLQMIYDAIEKDAQNVTYDKLYSTKSGDYRVSIVFSVESWDYQGNPDNHFNDVSIAGWMENTIALLKQYGIDPSFTQVIDNAKTAFLVKMNGVPAGADITEYGYVDEWYLNRSRAVGLYNISSLALFSISGDQEFAALAEQVLASGTNDGMFTDEKYPETTDIDIEYNDAEPPVYQRELLDPDYLEYLMNTAKSEYGYLSAVKLDLNSAEYKELIGMTGSVAPTGEDPTQDFYAMVLLNYTLEDYIYAEDTTVHPLYFPANCTARAAELFAKLS